MELVASIEAEFGVEMDEDAALSVARVSEMVDYVQKVLVQQSS